MESRKIGFIGAGLMAEALADGIIQSGVVPAENIYASDPAGQRRRVFKEKIGERVFSDNLKVTDKADVLVLAVKPQVIPDVAEELSSAVNHRHLVVSIAPGVTLASLEKTLGTDRLARVMPNTPALVGQGASAFCMGAGATHEDKELVQSILGAVGRCVQVKENLMDAATGLSGSGPAYMFMAIEALSDGGVEMGLPRDAATQLAAQTMIGAASMVLNTRMHPAELKDEVTTPGGTTAAGLHALEKEGLRHALMDAVKAAAERSKELGKQ